MSKVISDNMRPPRYIWKHRPVCCNVRGAGERLGTWTTLHAGGEPLLDLRKTPMPIKGGTYPRESWRNLKMNRVFSASQAGRFVLGWPTLLQSSSHGRRA